MTGNFRRKELLGSKTWNKTVYTEDEYSGVPFPVRLVFLHFRINFFLFIRSQFTLFISIYSGRVKFSSKDRFRSRQVLQYCNIKIYSLYSL